MIEEGQPLPPFKLPDAAGQERTFADLTGPNGLVLYVYPKDDTPGCTVEAENFRDLRDDFQARGYAVAGISKDSAASHGQFIDKYELNFTLLTDPDGSFLEALGAWGEKTNYGRTSLGILRSTYVTDAAGTVQRVYRNVRAQGHAARVLRDLG